MLRIRDYFKQDDLRKIVAKFFIESGLSVEKGEIYCNGARIPIGSIAEQLDVDEWVVEDTIDLIEEHIDLREIFRNLRSTAYFGKIAEQIDAGVIEITPEDPHGIGILAGVTKIIADYDISIRQCLTEDSELKEDPKLIVITEDTIPIEALEKIRKVKGIDRIDLY